MLEYRRRSAVPCPIVPAAPARAAVMCTRQLAGARMCSCRACAGSWQCVVECASLGRSRVCSRARVGVCRAGAAERAHSRWKRFARSRVAELPDVAASARAPALRWRTVIPPLYHTVLSTLTRLLSALGHTDFFTRKYQCTGAWSTNASGNKPCLITCLMKG